MKSSLKIFLAGAAVAAATLPASAQPPAFSISVGTPHVGVSVGTAPAPAYYPPPPPPAYYPPPAPYPPAAYAPPPAMPIVAPSYAYVRMYPSFYYFWNGRYYRRGYGPRYHRWH